MEKTDQEKTSSINIVRRHLLKSGAVAAPLVLTLGARNTYAQVLGVTSGPAPFSAMAVGSLNLNGTGVLSLEEGKPLYVGMKPEHENYYGKRGTFTSPSGVDNPKVTNLGNGAVAGDTSTLVYTWNFGQLGNNTLDGDQTYTSRAYITRNFEMGYASQFKTTYDALGLNATVEVVNSETGITFTFTSTAATGTSPVTYYIFDPLPTISKTTEIIGFLDDLKSVTAVQHSITP